MFLLYFNLIRLVFKDSWFNFQNVASFVDVSNVPPSFQDELENEFKVSLGFFVCENQLMTQNFFAFDSI